MFYFVFLWQKKSLNPCCSHKSVLIFFLNEQHQLFFTFNLFVVNGLKLSFNLPVLMSAAHILLKGFTLAWAMRAKLVTDDMQHETSRWTMTLSIGSTLVSPNFQSSDPYCTLSSHRLLSRNNNSVAVFANIQLLTPALVGQRCSCCRKPPGPAAPWSSSLPAPPGFPHHPDPPLTACWGAPPCERSTDRLESVAAPICEPYFNMIC